MPDSFRVCPHDLSLQAAEIAGVAGTVLETVKDSEIIEMAEERARI